jgi:tetratricopeptide (TPR) repeat protein
MDMVDDVNRREFLRLLSMAGTLLTAPALEGPMDWERMDFFADRRRGLDDQTIDQYGVLNSQLWQAFASATPKTAAFHMVRDQLTVLTSSLEESHDDATHRRLSALAGDLFQLAGEIFFDGNHYADAAQCYMAAANASKEAKAFDLWACAMTRHAFIRVYEQNFGDAVPMLELADRVARRGDSTLSTRHWINIVRAQAAAGVGELDACQAAIYTAEKVHGLDGPVHNGGWLRFDGSRLAEECGACYVELGRPDLAETALTEALRQDLSRRRLGIVLTDLAMVGVQHHDPDELLEHGQAAIELAKETGSGVVDRKLWGLQAHLAPFLTDARIRELDDQITGLARSTPTR